MSRLLEKYKTNILPKLKTTLGRENVHSIPRITKVVVSMGLGKALADRKRVDEAVDHLRTIVGQKPQVTKSRIAVSGFRLREGVDVGCKVTLRGSRMYDFIDRLITLALPRVRDFRGVRSTGFDGNGNFSMGLNEQMADLFEQMSKGMRSQQLVHRKLLQTEQATNHRGSNHHDEPRL